MIVYTVVRAGRGMPTPYEVEWSHCWGDPPSIGEWLSSTSLPDTHRVFWSIRRRR